MSWKKTCETEERFQFIEDWKQKDWNFTELCDRFEVSRKTGYKWLERYQAEGLDGLQERSRAPLWHPNQVVPEVAEALAETRDVHPSWGPVKLKAYLEREAPEIVWPAASTIGVILAERGLVVPRKRRRRGAGSAASGVVAAAGPNAVWSVDFKGWFRCGCGARCDPLTISDAFSRFVLRCQALTGEKTALVHPVFQAAFQEYGLPERMRSDNGPPFAAPGLAGLSELAVWWIKLGIHPERITPGRPSENGRHERMHRVLKQETAQPPAEDLRAQQHQFDRFRQEYNYQRPHEALGLQVPGDLYVPSPRGYPSRLPEIAYPGAYHVRWVGPCGTMRWASGKVFVSKALAGEPVGLEAVAEGRWRLWFSFYELGEFDERQMAIQRVRQRPAAPPIRDLGVSAAPREARP